jgi:hypothetical protein
MNSSFAPSRLTRWLSVLGCTAAFVWRLAAVDHPTTNALNEHLEVLRPLLGKTFRGELKSSAPVKVGETAKVSEDIARWERALNGQAVRILHSVNQGAYGGETLITWSKEKNSLVYHYFTTAGYETTGKMTEAGNKFTTLESVTGDADGVTEVKAVTMLRPDGTYAVIAEYLKNGKWEPGHSATYHEDAKAEVVFK